MKCVKCGAEIRKNHKFCENCGYPNEAYEAEVKSTEKDDDPDDFFEDVREKKPDAGFSRVSHYTVSGSDTGFDGVFGNFGENDAYGGIRKTANVFISGFRYFVFILFSLFIPLFGLIAGISFLKSKNTAKGIVLMVLSLFPTIFFAGIFIRILIAFFAVM